MIRLQIDAEHYELDDALRQRVEDKLGELDTYMSSLDQGHVTVSWDGGPGEQTRVRAQVWGRGRRFEASDTDRDATTAVDRTHHKLATQIRREHGKEIAARDGR